MQTNTFPFSASEHGHNHFSAHFGFLNMTFYDEMSLVVFKKWINIKWNMCIFFNSHKEGKKLLLRPLKEEEKRVENKVNRK